MKLRHSEPIVYRNYVDHRCVKVGLLNRRWTLRDGMTGPLLAEGVAHTERGARRSMALAIARCFRLSPLAYDVYHRFAEELHKAGPDQFIHLARRAEGQYRTPLGDAMRALVDAERAVRRGAGA